MPGELKNLLAAAALRANPCRRCGLPITGKGDAATGAKFERVGFLCWPCGAALLVEQAGLRVVEFVRLLSENYRDVGYWPEMGLLVVRTYKGAVLFSAGVSIEDYHGFLKAESKRRFHANVISEKYSYDVFEYAPLGK